MSFIKNIFKELIKYKEFIIFMCKIELKRQIIATAGGYLWWILDPLLHMLIYSIMVSFIFKKGDLNFPIFVFCALLPWKWASSSFSGSVGLIKSKASILQQVYIPKYILTLIVVSINFFKFLIGLCILGIMIFLYKLKISITYIYILLIIFQYFIFIIGISIWITHLGVFFKDLKNLLPHLLRFWFYLSPGVYSLEKIPQKYQILWLINPNTTYFEELRKVLLYGEVPNMSVLSIWTCINLIIIYLGLKKLYYYDRYYIKVA